MFPSIGKAKHLYSML